MIGGGIGLGCWVLYVLKIMFLFGFVSFVCFGFGRLSVFFFFFYVVRGGVFAFEVWTGGLGGLGRVYCFVSVCLLID